MANCQACLSPDKSVSKVLYTELMTNTEIKSNLLNQDDKSFTHYVKETFSSPVCLL